MEEAGTGRGGEESGIARWQGDADQHGLLCETNSEQREQRPGARALRSECYAVPARKRLQHTHTAQAGGVHGPAAWILTRHLAVPPVFALHGVACVKHIWRAERALKHEDEYGSAFTDLPKLPLLPPEVAVSQTRAPHPQ